MRSCGTCRTPDRRGGPCWPIVTIKLTDNFMNGNHKQALSGVTLAAIGVVYGDIGTSPLYTLRECLSGQFGFGVEPASILGFLSLIFWLLILVVSVKYLSFVMRADNAGEGASSP